MVPSAEQGSTWTSKIVLHRGWHRLVKTDVTKPIENTREAYLQAAELGAAYAECDVWVTRDGQIVLSHDSTFASLVSPGYASRNFDVQKPIDELDWATVKNFELLDGSKPVLLSTVLDDLKKTNTRLAIELKSSRLALPLAKYLLRKPELVPAVGFIMGFAIDTVIIFRGAVGNHATLGKLKVLWLVDNPARPYVEEAKDEGETTFDYLNDSLTNFIRAQPEAELLLSVGFHGLYFQYCAGLMSSHVTSIRQELSFILGRPPSEVFVGIWSDSDLDPGFDRPETLAEWAVVADALNTDCDYMKSKDEIPPVLARNTKGY